MHLYPTLGEREYPSKQIKVFYKSADQTRLSYNPKGDWVDLYSAEDVVLAAGSFKLIDLGVVIQLPYNHEAHIVPRGSTFKTWGILQTNSMGIVDESYCGPDDWWKFPAYATKDTEIRKGDKICQFRAVEKMRRWQMTEIIDAPKGESRGGFGSSGTK